MVARKQVKSVRPTTKRGRAFWALLQQARRRKRKES